MSHVGRSHGGGAQVGQSHGYELHQRLSAALGDAQAELNPGQVYVALSRRERGGIVTGRGVPQGSRPDKRVYEVTAAGREMVVRWLVVVPDRLHTSGRVHTAAPPDRGPGPAGAGRRAVGQTVQLASSSLKEICTRAR